MTDVEILPVGGITAGGVDNPNPCSMCGTMEGDRCTANHGITFCEPCFRKFQKSSDAARRVAERIWEEAHRKADHENFISLLIFLGCVFGLALLMFLGWALR
jgi:hypothetical protein